MKNEDIFMSSLVPPHGAGSLKLLLLPEFSRGEVIAVLQAYYDGLRRQDSN